MAGETETTAPASTVATDALPAGGTVPANQPQLGGDRLAAILAKQASGQTLSASERGYLGAVKRRSKPKAATAAASPNVLLDVPPTPAQPAAPAPAPAGNELFEPQAEGSPLAADPAGVLAVSAADSAVIQDAAGAILDSMDTTTKLYIAHEARLAGANEETCRRYEAAVALNPRNRDLMAKNSEPVVLALCKFFRCTPDKLAGVLKNSAFFAGLFSHAMTVLATVKSIRESQKERPQVA
jgi:hypothetical protein